MASAIVLAVTRTNLCGDGSEPGQLLPHKNKSRSDGMGINRRRRTATAKQYAQRHLLRRLREAGHGLSTDLNPAYERIYAIGVEKQRKQSRSQMIPGEARVVEQQPFGDILGRVGSMSGCHTTPTASNEVISTQRTLSGSGVHSRRVALLMRINCVTSSTGLQKREALASSQVWLTFRGRESSLGTPLSTLCRQGGGMLVGESSRKTACWTPCHRRD